MDANVPTLDAVPPAEPKQTSVWTWLGFPLVAFCLSRAAIFGLTGLGLMIDPRLHRGAATIALPALRGLCWWDCNWYRSVGDEGYTVPERAVFFPLYPLISKAVAIVTTLETPLAMILVSNLAALGAYVCIYRIFTELSDAEGGKAGLLLLMAWPFSFIHAAAYPESMMLLSTSGALLLAMRRRHVLAGTALGLGVLCRHLTLLAGLGLLAAQLKERGFHPRRFFGSWSFLGLLVPFLIAGTYPVYCYFHYGDPWLWWTARGTYWGELAWMGLPQFFLKDGWEPQIGAYVVLSVIPAVGAGLLLVQRKWVLAAFAVGLMLTVYTIGLAALGRYTASCWPVFLPFGVYLARRQMVTAAVVSASAMMQGLFLFLFSHSYQIN